MGAICGAASLGRALRLAFRAFRISQPRACPRAKLRAALRAASITKPMQKPKLYMTSAAASTSTSSVMLFSSASRAVRWNRLSTELTA